MHCTEWRPRHAAWQFERHGGAAIGELIVVRPHWSVMEESSDDNRESWMTRLLWILAWAFAIYILFFELFVLDECWLKTFFIAKHAPPG